MNRCPLNSGRLLLAAPLIVGVCFLNATGSTGAAAEHRSTVGIPARIEQLVLPGSELRAAPLEDDRVPVVVRIVATFSHGTAFRYDLEYYGLEPGTYDLKNYLQRADGSPVTDLPAVIVEIESVLPPGQVQPNALPPGPVPRLGGYGKLLRWGACAWLIGLIAILAWIRVGIVRGRRLSREIQAAPSLADRLRPIIQHAIAGKLNDIQLAELERMLLVFWRRRLKLDQLTAADAIQTLRRHPDAGLLLEQLEVWLHRPGTAGSVDIATLLAPYRDLPADAMEGG